MAALIGVGTLTLSTFQDQSQAIERASRAIQTNPETTSLEKADAQRWLSGEVSVLIDSSVNEVLPNADQAIMQAFGAWLSSIPNLPELRVESGQGLKPRLDPDGVNAVMYAPIEFPGHEDDLAITIGFSDEETGEITEADIIINSRHIYAALDSDSAGAPTQSCDGSTNGSVCGSRYDLQNVMTHEVGHFYGLGEDRLDRSATMYSCTSACETHKRDPSASDKRAMAALYVDSHQRHRSWAGCHGAQIAPPGRLWGWPLACMFGLLALMRRRRQPSTNKLSS